MVLVPSLHIGTSTLCLRSRCRYPSSMSSQGSLVLHLNLQQLLGLLSLFLLLLLINQHHLGQLFQKSGCIILRGILFLRLGARTGLMFRVEHSLNLRQVDQRCLRGQVGVHGGSRTGRASPRFCIKQ